MKKVYSKPQIMFEDFTLSTNIAAGCEIIVEGPSSGTCGYAYEGGGGATLFTEALGSSICSEMIADCKENGFCYHVPIEDNSLFNS